MVSGEFSCLGPESMGGAGPPRARKVYVYNGLASRNLVEIPYETRTVSLLQQELCDWNDLKQYKKSDCNKSIFARARIAGKLVLLGLRVTTNGFLSGSGVQQKARLRQKSDCNEKVRL